MEYAPGQQPIPPPPGQQPIPPPGPWPPVPPPLAPPQAPRPRRTGGGGTKIAITLAVLAGLVVGGYLLYGQLFGKTGKGGAVTELNGPPSDPFTIAYPAGWQALARKQVLTLPGKQLAVIGAKGGKGLVAVRRQGPVPSDLIGFSQQLEEKFKKRLPGFQQRGASMIDVRAGKALLYAYTRRGTNNAYTLVVVPVGDHSYAINATLRGGSGLEVERHVAQMIGSFDAN